MGFFGGFLDGFLGRWGRGGAVARARAAEGRGDLAEAAALFAEAGMSHEAARVTLLRGDAEVEPAGRLGRYVQAAALAGPGSDVGDRARRKRAELLLTLADGAPVTATLRQDLREAAADLEALALPLLAAQAWAKVGDAEGEARALAAAGDIDRLEGLLSAGATGERRAREAGASLARFEELVACGRRREALASAEGTADAALAQGARSLRARRVAGDVASIVLQGRALRVVVSDEVVVGREGPVAVASAAVSRRHVALRRRGGLAVLADLGTRNGTALRGLPVEGELDVGEGLEVMLGGEVPLRVRPSPWLPGAFELDVGGQTLLAGLGPLSLGVGGWTLARGGDGWLELRAEEGAAYAGTYRLDPPVSLLVGDAVSIGPGAPPALVVGEP